MLRRSPQTRADHGANHQGTHGFAAEHIPELGRLVEDLIETDAHKINEHELDNGAQARSRRADSGADEGGLRNGGVHNPVTELTPQPLGYSERTAPSVHFAV